MMTEVTSENIKSATPPESIDGPLAQIANTVDSINRALYRRVFLLGRAESELDYRIINSLSIIDRMTKTKCRRLLRKYNIEGAKQLLKIFILVFCPILLLLIVVTYSPWDLNNQLHLLQTRMPASIISFLNSQLPFEPNLLVITTLNEQVSSLRALAAISTFIELGIGVSIWLNFDWVWGICYILLLSTVNVSIAYTAIVRLSFADLVLDPNKWSVAYFALQGLYWAIFVLSGLGLFLGSSFILVYITTSLVYRNDLQGTLARRLVYLLNNLRKNHAKWESLPYRLQLFSKIQTIALTIARDLPSYLKSKDPQTGDWIKTAALEISNDLLALRYWLLTPQPQTKNDLESYLAKVLTHVAANHWDLLPRRPLDTNRRVRTFGVVNFAKTALRAFLPLAIFLVFQRFGLVFPNGLSDYIVVGMFFWILLTFVIAYDPLSSAKLEVFKSFWPFGKG